MHGTESKTYEIIPYISGFTAWMATRQLVKMSDPVWMFSILVCCCVRGNREGGVILVQDLKTIGNVLAHALLISYRFPLRGREFEKFFAYAFILKSLCLSPVCVLLISNHQLNFYFF